MTHAPTTGIPIAPGICVVNAVTVPAPSAKVLRLCSVGARRKSRFLALGAEERRFFGAPKKKNADWSPAQADIFISRPFFVGGAFKKKKVPPPPPPSPPPLPPSPPFNIGPRAGAHVSGYVFRCERRKKNGGAEKNFGGRNCFWEGRKSYLATEHHNEAAPKKKKEPRFFRLGTEKYDFRAPKEQRPRRSKRLSLS